MAKLSGLTEKERELRLSKVATIRRPGTAAMLKACRSFVENPLASSPSGAGSEMERRCACRRL